MTEPVSRREQNKTRTREGLLEALRTVASGPGLDMVTVEDIAERAGVSRRTFFNYFPSIEAAVAEGTSAPLAGIEQAFLARPPEESPLTAVINALRANPLPDELVTWMYALGCSATSTTSTVVINVWQHHRGWLEGLLTQRIGEHDPLRVTTLAAAIMAVLEACEAFWVDALGTGADVDARASAQINTILIEGLEHARSGWAD